MKPLLPLMTACSSARAIDTVHCAARRLLRGVLPGAALVAASMAVAGPGELTVLGLAPLEDALGAVVAAYERDTGRRVVLSYTTPSWLAAKLKGAEHPDIVVLDSATLDALEAGGHTAAGSRAALGRVGLGVAVRQGAALPDVSTPAAFRQALLGAGSIAYLDPADDAGGRQVADVVAGLGLTDALQPKTRLGTGRSALAPVALGAVDLGLYPLNRIVATQGVQSGGPLPAQLQRWTRYDAALTDDAPNVGEARELLRYLTGDAARAGFALKGFQPSP